MLRAGYQYVVQMDADFSHDPGRLPALREALDQADVVLGSRDVAGGGVCHWPLRRRLLSWAGSSYAALVLGLPSHDMTSGFKGFNRRALEALNLAKVRSTGYAFQIEVTYRCHRLGFHIAELPIMFEDRRTGASKMSRLVVTEALLLVWRLRFEELRQRRRLRWSDLAGAVR